MKFHQLLPFVIAPSLAVATNNGTKGAVASENRQCTQIGIDLLEAGGTAADALVGTQFCVGVIGMYHSGIGGGGFMLVRTGGSNNTYEFIDFREKAPAAAFTNMYVNDTDLSLYGGLASGVPGDLRGQEYMHNKYGKLSWKQCIMPAVKLAREGFIVTNDTVNYFKSAVAGGPNFLVEDPNWAIDFAPNGTLVKVGDLMTRKRYADTIETIANYGADVFYEGPIANATIQALKASGGTMTLTDLKNYSVAIRNPSQITYRGYKITSGSAPSSGEVALSVMKTIEGYNDVGNPASINLTTHRIDEAMRWAYAEREQLGDPFYVSSVNQYQLEMDNATSAASIRSKISDATSFNTSYYDPAGLGVLTDGGTSHIVAADKDGMAISVTTTINTLFGSQVLVPETGVIMNNEMNDFSIPGQSNVFGYAPTPNNYVEPGKRPLSSISPTLVETADGHFFAAFGSAGGSRIITATIQNMWHVIDQGANCSHALAEPRLHDQLIPNQVSFEYAYNNETVAFMKSRNHNVTWIAPGQSTAQCVRRLSNGTFDAAGEPRQLASAGYSI